MDDLQIGYQLIDIRNTVSAVWNYKGDHSKMMLKLIHSIVDDGFIVSCLVRTTENDELEVVDGNHRREAVIKILSWVEDIESLDQDSDEYFIASKYLSMKLDLSKIMCYYLGNISELKAKELSFKINENRFPSDKDKMKTILEELVEIHGDDIFNFIPLERDDFFSPDFEMEFSENNYQEYSGMSDEVESAKTIKFIVSEELYQKWIAKQTEIQVYEHISSPADIFEHILDSYETTTNP